MRRKDREITDPAEIRQILTDARILHLGLHDGTHPYVVPLHYGCTWQKGTPVLYVHCAGEGHKLDCLRRDPHVFVEIDTGETMVSGGDVACSYGALYASVMGPGLAAVVTDTAEKVLGLRALMKTQTGRDFEITEAMTAGVEVIRIEMLSCTAKARKK